MNKIYFKGRQLYIDQLVKHSGFNISDVEMADRISGEHCNCGPDLGEFDLLPKSDPMVREGKKRYMRCRKCGCISHL